MSDLQVLLFQLQLSSVRLDSRSKDAQKDERIQRNKMTKAIQQGKFEEAKIYAENSIMKKNEAQEYLRMSSRIATLCSKFQKAIEIIEVVEDAIASAATRPTLSAQVQSLIAQGVEDNRQEQLAAAQSIPSGSITAAAADISHAEVNAPSSSLLQSCSVATDSVVHIIQNMTPEQRSEVLNTIRALETRIGMDSSTEPAEHIS